MKISLTDRLLLCLIICSLWVSGIFAQDISETIRLAENQFNSGNYRPAAKLYLRCAFFGDRDEISHLYGKTADCFYMLEEYNRAIDFYNQAATYESDLLTRSEFLLHKSNCYLLTGNFQFALFELLGIPDELPGELLFRKNFMLGLAYFGTGQYESAENHFKLTTGDDQAKNKEIEEIFATRKNLFRPNPKKAMIMSMIVPGSGQMYAGDIKNGIYSLSLVSALVYLTIRVAAAYTWFDAVIAVLPWMQRYYMGSFVHAEEIAIEKRAENRNETYKEIYKIILD
ncbi:MAG: hypothetical protein KDC05_03750 [Bacteroidales bacterium]|nr:hypothetical protein [Bacteroidales bacterium]